jgi:Na+/melibiose symporter-like transporter
MPAKMLSWSGHDVSWERIGSMGQAGAASASRPEPRPGAADIGLFAVGSFGTGVFSTVPAVLLLYYCTEILKIPTGWATALVFGPKAWAIIWDPLVGSWSDRTCGRWGRRRPFMLVGSVGVALSFFGLFAAPIGNPDVATLWVALSYFSLTTLYSLFAVPYISVPCEIRGSAADRSRLVAARMTMAMVGVLAGAGFAPMLVGFGGGGRPGYMLMGLSLAAACGAAMMSPLLMLRHYDGPRDRKEDRIEPPGLLAGAAQALGHRELRSLALNYYLMLAAAGSFTSAIPYLVGRVMGRSDLETGVALLALFAATAACVPAWSYAGRKWGDARVLAAGVVGLALCIAMLGAIALNGTSWSLLMLLLACCGMAFAATQALPFVLIAQIIHEEQAGAEGLLTGFWTAVEKLGLASGPALTGLALMLGGSNLALSIPLFMTTVPPVLLVVSLLPLGQAALQARHQLIRASL